MSSLQRVDPRVGKGVLGYAQKTANQGPVAAGTITDITGLSVTVTVEANRRIRVEAQFKLSGSDNPTIFGLIREGSTQLQELHAGSHEFPETTPTVHGAVILSPSAGSHTYKVSFEHGDETGNVSLQASTDAPAYILVEDIGSA